MQLTCGVDWAEAHHDGALVDVDGAVVARSRIDAGASGFNDLLVLIAEHGGSAQDTPIAIETDKNLLVVALAEAGFTVYPIYPRAVARYRERYGQAGGKSDPGDAAVLAHILRTDRHLHRPLPAVSEQGRAVKAWPDSIRRRSGRCITPSTACGRCCWSSIRKRCKRFRTSHTRLQ
ncbi:MAG: hypothetical protein QOH91_246 [Mycobacterium sp.]|jgi:transposase|nr:hypothetical protein [Mycobacterium sp.]